MPSQLPTRKIGQDNVSAIGWGSMGISICYDTRGTDEERLKFLDDLHASGCTNWDTANVYGDAEDILGQWFARSGKRKDVFIATKCGIVFEDRHVNCEPEYVKACVEQSLKRLNVDCIDLYYLHRPDPLVPIEKSIGALAECVKAGKIRYIGISECSAATLRRAYAVHPIAAIQIEYSLFTLDAERPEVNVIQAARELGVTVLAYSPLGRGMLSGQFRSADQFGPKDFRRTIPRYSQENFPKMLKIVDAVAAMATKYNATPSQIAIAWVVAQGNDIIPIPGTTKVKSLRDNLGSLQLKLSKEDIEELRTLARNVDLGDRYASSITSYLFGDTPEL